MLPVETSSGSNPSQPLANSTDKPLQLTNQTSMNRSVSCHLVNLDDMSTFHPKRALAAKKDCLPRAASCSRLNAPESSGYLYNIGEDHIHFNSSDSFYIPSKDGTKLHARVWKTEQQPDEILIIAHGMGEHSGCYQGLAEKAANKTGDAHQKNIQTYAFDFRGHGLSQGKTGAIRSYQHLHSDLAAMLHCVHALHPNTPINILGHSMGGGLVINHLLKHQSTLDEMHINHILITNPWITLQKQPAWLDRWKGWIAGNLFPEFTVDVKDHVKIQTGRTPAVDLFCHTKISPNLFLGAESAGLENLRLADKIDEDLARHITIMHTPVDEVTNPKSSESFALQAKVNFHPLPEMNHTPHVSQRRAEFYDTLINELQKTISKPAPQAVKVEISPLRRPRKQQLVEVKVLENPKFQQEDTPS